jgi:hypothetical protein
MHILKVSIVGSGFQNQDFGIDVFGEAACDYTS